MRRYSQIYNPTIKRIIATGGSWLRHALTGKRVTVTVTVVVAAAALALAGCKTMQFGKAGIVPEIIRSQTPGEATGAGGSITGPTNSAAPTTQVAERRAAYFPPFPAPAERVQTNTPTGSPMGVATPVGPLASIPQPQPVPQAVASTYERTETTFGQHQSATGIVKAAAALESWSTFRWLGLLTLIVGVGGMLWSYNNEHGYMMVFMKVAGVGAFCLMTSDNPLWLLLLMLPAGFYAVQKFNLLRLP